MSNEKALMLAIKGCLIAFFNKLYGNNTPGALLDWITLPRCLPCSNCLPRFIGPLYFPNPSAHPLLAPFVVSAPSHSSAPSRPVEQKLTKKMRATAEEQLRKFRDRIYSLEQDSDGHGCTPLSAYFSNPTIASVLGQFFQITTHDILSATIPRWKHHARHGEALLAIIGGLQREFAIEFEATRLERNKKNRLRAKSKRKRADELEEGEEEEDEPNDNNEEVVEDVPEPPPAAPSRPTPRRIQQRGALEDVTNAPCAKRQALERAAVVAATFGPQYKTSRRTEN
ncbi:hypothetical protein B0H14DRAFT_2583042 [Mycena olivaceomarginata]|nr:hypothetical protein B0H14DRAFT_2583042 [Mycena olivaceomarginata]